MLSRLWTIKKIGHHQEQQIDVIPHSENLNTTATASLMGEHDQAITPAETAKILQTDKSSTLPSLTGKGDPKGIVIDK